MRATTGSIPIRAQLTIVLVLIVFALALSLTLISYRIAWRSLQTDAVSSLENVADSRVDAVTSLLVHKQERLASATKSVELACDAAGRFNVVCAKETLRPFLRKEHARGAVLTYRRGHTVSFGSPTDTDSGGKVFLALDPRFNGQTVIGMSYVDEESGLKLQVHFASQELRETALADPGHPVTLLTNINGQVQNLLRGTEVKNRSAALKQCLDGIPGWTTESDGTGPIYRVYRYIPRIRMCVVAETPHATVLAPITRLRAKLAKTVIGFIVGSILVAYLLGYLLTHPLKVMKERVRKLKAGDFESPVPIVGTGEIRDFSEALASMANSLRSSRMALVESERKLTLAYKAAGLWMWSYDFRSAKLNWQNPSEADPPQRWLSFRSVLRTIDERDRHSVVTAIRTAKQTGQFEIECRPKPGDGETWISAWGQVVNDAIGRAVSITGVSLDSTSRKQAQRLTSESEKLLATADMAASLAHEINNPLSSVVGAIYMASSIVNDSPELKRYLDIARQETDRVACIARDMLALYRKPSNAQAVDLRRMLQDVVADCRGQADRKQQKFAIKIECRGTVFGFPDELRQALMNLVVNAMEHSPNGEIIKIRAHRSHSYSRVAERGVRILVANEGESALPSKLESVFAPFVSTKTQRGHGLGLWVTKSVVLKHGGTIRLRSFGHSGVCCAIYIPMRTLAPQSENRLCKREWR